MGAMADPVAAVPASLAAASDFSAWVLAEQRRVFLLCQRMLQDPDEADSATQDVFLKAYTALQKQADEIDEPGRWLTRIAVNTCLDRLRSQRWQFWRRRPEPADEVLILSMTPSKTPDAERQVLSGEVGRRLGVAMNRLSGRQRAVFALRHYEDRSIEEIADLLGLDQGTVKAHLARALAKLRVELKDLYSPRGA